MTSDIAIVLRHYGGDPPSGTGWRRMLCVFHDERRPSAQVNHELNAYVCLACDVKGDAIKLLMDQEGIGFNAATTLLSELGGGDGLVLRQRRRGRRIPDKQRHYGGDGSTLPLGSRHYTDGGS